MNRKGRKFFLTSKSFIYAVAVHAFIGALLFVSLGLDKSSVFSPRRSPSDAQPVEAMALTEADIDRQMKRLEEKDLEKLAKTEEAQQKLEELQRQTRAAEEKRRQEEQKIAEEQEKLAKIQEKKKQEAIKAKALAKKRQEQELKLAKLEKEKQAKLEEQKKAEQEKQRELAAKKKREAEKKKQQELAAKKKREEERKKQAELARLDAEKRQKEAELLARLEEERLESLFNRALSQYTPIIRQKVSRNWNQPANTQRGIIARVVVRLTPTGEVISAQVIQSSGNPIFDRSVENAVYKASPLPIPTERGVNEKFRSLNLTFKPEDLIS